MTVYGALRNPEKKRLNTCYIFFHFKTKSYKLWKYILYLHRPLRTIKNVQNVEIFTYHSTNSVEQHCHLNLWWLFESKRVVQDFWVADLSFSTLIKVFVFYRERKMISNRMTIFSFIRAKSAQSQMVS